MSAKFEFLSDFNFEVRSAKGALQGAKQFRAGQTHLLTQEQLAAAEAANVGRRVEGEEKPKGKAKE